MQDPLPISGLPKLGMGTGRREPPGLKKTLRITNRRECGPDRDMDGLALPWRPLENTNSLVPTGCLLLELLAF